jgi:uncharacterized protein (DUF1015 family)
MPKLYPFQAYRYDLPSGQLPSAVCPPYDVIGEKLEAQLRRLPKNAIHVELPAGSPETKYKRARSIWEQWKRGGIVRRDAAPAFYVYEQAFKVGSRRLVRRGFFCEVKVEEPGKGSVLRHELTISGPKADRLNLIRTMRINTSPIFGLFRDPGKKVGKALSKFSGRRPLAQVKDREGVVHRLWRCEEGRELEAIRKGVERSPILIADGHHRYETSWNYRKEMKAKGNSDRMLFFVCSMDDPGLEIFPTHRLVKNPKALSLEQILKKAEALKEIFSVERMASPDRLPKGASFAVTDGKKAFAVSVKSYAKLAKKLPGRSPAYLRLPLVHIHKLLLPAMEKEDFTYVHDGKETLALARKNKAAALLVPATTTKELYDVVRSGEVMPQKSTYFYPKVITGLLFRSLD